MGALPTKRRTKYGGRKKGTPNKIPSALREMVLQALADEGGVAYLRKQARKQPVAFMSLLGRLLPLQAQLDHRVPSLEDLIRKSFHAEQTHPSAAMVQASPDPG